MKEAIGYINYRVIDLLSTTGVTVQKRYETIEEFEKAIQSIKADKKEKLEEFGKRKKFELIEIINIVSTIKYKKYLSEKYKGKGLEIFNAYSKKILLDSKINEFINEDLSIDKLKDGKSIVPKRKPLTDYNFDKRIEKVLDFAHEKKITLLNPDGYKNARTIMSWKCKKCKHVFNDEYNRIKNRNVPCPNCMEKEKENKTPKGLINAHKFAKEHGLEIVDDSNYNKKKFDNSYITWKCGHGKRRVLAIQTVKRIVRDYGKGRCPVCEIQTVGRARKVVEYNGNAISFE